MERRVTNPYAFERDVELLNATTKIIVATITNNDAINTCLRGEMKLKLAGPVRKRDVDLALNLV